jgi:hypothetical protein
VAGVPGRGPTRPASRAGRPGHRRRLHGREGEYDAGGVGQRAAQSPIATAWEAEVVSARAQLRQDRAASRGRGPGRVRPRRGPRKPRD